MQVDLDNISCTGTMYSVLISYQQGNGLNIEVGEGEVRDASQTIPLCFSELKASFLKKVQTSHPIKQQKEH